MFGTIKKFEDRYCIFCEGYTKHDINNSSITCLECKREKSLSRATQSGFTMIEMAIVTALIALVLAIAIPNLSASIASTESAKTEKELQSIYTAIVMFQSHNRRPPITWEELGDYIAIANIEEKYELNAGG